MLCAVRVPGEPVLTTDATCGTAVRSSLGSAGPLQWSQLKHMLQTFIHTRPEVSVQLKLCKAVVSAAFIQRCKVLAQCIASALRSSAEAASSGTQHLAQKLDCARLKSQLFHTTPGLALRGGGSVGTRLGLQRPGSPPQGPVCPRLRPDVVAFPRVCAAQEERSRTHAQFTLLIHSNFINLL